MDARYLRTLEKTAISCGVIAHLLGPGLVMLNEFPGPFLAILHRFPVPAWTLLYPLSLVCFIAGIAAHLLSKGYQPLTRTTFYALAVVTALPVFGPVAAFLKLHAVPPRDGDGEEQLAIVLNAAVVILAFVGVLYWAVLHHLFAGYHLRAAVNRHLASAQTRLAAALTHNPHTDRTARNAALAAAVDELHTVLSYRTTFGRRDALLLLGDTYREQGKWADAEASYREALEILPGDPVLLSRLKDLRAQKTVAAPRRSP